MYEAVERELHGREDDGGEYDVSKKKQRRIQNLSSD